MSQIGTGSEDWVELDLDQFERASHGRLEQAIAAHHDRIRQLVGNAEFATQSVGVGRAHLIVAGQPRYAAELNAIGRLVLTALPHEDGPL